MLNAGAEMNWRAAFTGCRLWRFVCRVNRCSIVSVMTRPKVALFHLVEHLNKRRFVLFDIQTITPTTKKLGAIEISRDDYLRRLAVAVALVRAF